MRRLVVRNFTFIVNLVISRSTLDREQKTLLAVHIKTLLKMHALNPAASLQAIRSYISLVSNPRKHGNRLLTEAAKRQNF